MFELEKAVALFLLLNVGAGLVRIVRGPTPADRMLAVQLLGTTGVAVLLLLARGLENPAFRDIALVFSLLSVVTGAAFVKLFWKPSSGKAEESG